MRKIFFLTTALLLSSCKQKTINDYNALLNTHPNLASSMIRPHALQVAFVTDSNTITLRAVNKNDIEIKLFGITTNNSSTPQGIKAIGALKDLIRPDGFTKPDDVHCYKTPHQKPMAVCFNGKGQDLALTLIKMGLAHAEDKYFTWLSVQGDNIPFTDHLQPKYNKAEKYARHKKLGIWK